MAAHDLRHPISAISMAISILEATQKNDDNAIFKKMVEMITNQSKAMLALLNDILNDNLIQSGLFTMNKQKVNIKNFIEEIREFHSLIASKNHIEIQVEEKIAQPICNIDKIKIKQVIDNFVSNAIKFSPPNSVVKIVCLTTETNLRVEVQDQGLGIPLKDRDKVFEQVAKIVSKSSGKETHGLGLTICKQIIRAHKGEIGIYSIGDKGAVFFFDVKI